MDGLRNYFYEISKKKDKDLKEFIKNNENRKNIASKLDTISFSENEKFDTYIGHINNMTRFLNERPIKNRTVLYRGEQTDRLLNTQNVNDNDSQKLGDAIDSFIKNNKNDPVKIKNFVNEKLKERTFVQKEFMSTTLNKDLATSWAVGRYTGSEERKEKEYSPIVWKISVPTGTKAAFIETFNPMNTPHNDQHEILVRRDSRLIFENSSFNDKKGALMIEARLEQPENTVEFPETLIDAKNELSKIISFANLNPSTVSDRTARLVKDMSQKIAEAIEGVKENIGTKENELCEAMGKMTVKNSNKNSNKNV